ncbi:MAG: type II secretion system protein GspE, partial [Fimbriimonas ginsengisoli]|nr:type II secretion system protein GspE [Fimbriimonas ginsengisoli]
MATTTKLTKKALQKLGERLVESGAITPEQLRQALDRQQQTGEFLGESIAALGLVTGPEVGRVLEEATGFPFVDLGEQTIDLMVARSITEMFARSRRVLPFKEEDGVVHVAMADPL